MSPPWLSPGCLGSGGRHFLRVIKGLLMDAVHNRLLELYWDREKVCEPFTNCFAWYYGVV